MLELDDIQHLLLTRAPALTGRYEFLSFRDGAGGRAWVSAIKENVHSAASMRATVDHDKRWVSAAFTWNGFARWDWMSIRYRHFRRSSSRAWRRGRRCSAMPAATPRHWVGGLANPDLHAIVILFARDDAEHDRCVSEHKQLIASCPGVEVLSVLDLHAIPPFNYAHEHFGYRDRLSEPAIEGNGDEPTPGTGEPLKPGEFILGYPDEHGVIADSPQPEILARNGSYMAYRRLEEHVGKFRDFLRQHGETAEEQELIAAKLMGRWRSGAPLVLAPEQGRSRARRRHAAEQRLHLQGLGPAWLCGPAWLAHSADESSRHGANINRRRMIRRGATYGPPLPEGAPDDGVERGIAAFVICASLIRQFEFAQNVWTNDRNFNELGNERDPIIGTQDGTLEFKIPKRPIRKKIVGLPAFTTLRGGAYFFLPGLKALGYLASLN